jgi:hypothetical protein
MTTYEAHMLRWGPIFSPLVIIFGEGHCDAQGGLTEALNVRSKEHMPSEDKYTKQLVEIHEEVNQANSKKYEDNHAKWKEDMVKVGLPPAFATINK